METRAKQRRHSTRLDLTLNALESVMDAVSQDPIGTGRLSATLH
ncbi:hypothetical protein [Sodalis sp. RH16]